MKRTVIVLLASVAVSCGSSNSSNDGNEPAGANPPAAQLNADCTQETQLACDVNILVQCSGGQWRGVQDCSGSNLQCAIGPSGEPDCVTMDSGGMGTGDTGTGGTGTGGTGTGGTGTGGTGTGMNGGSCGMNGHTPGMGAQIGMHDRDLFGYYQVYSYELDPSGQPTSALILIAVPGLALNQPYSFEGANSKFETVAEVALVGLDAQNKTYMADGGSVSFSELGDVGGQFAATLSDIQMREVNMEGATTVDVAGGVTWCVETVHINATLIRFVCDLLQLQPGQTACLSPQIVAECRAGTGMQNMGELHPGAACVAPQRCVDSTPVGTAICQ